MTEEQIQQNAEKYATDFHIDDGSPYIDTERMESYLAGAHSRDEEIKELEERIHALELGAKVNEYFSEAKEDRLRNPWISVKDRLPKEGEMVFTHSIIKIEGGGVANEDEQFLVQKFVGYWMTDACKQHRMLGILYDTIDKVTHWMPIPKIEKGE